MLLAEVDALRLSDFMEMLWPTDLLFSRLFFEAVFFFVF